MSQTEIHTQPEFILLTGNCGAGKTTILNQLSHISFDETIDCDIFKTNHPQYYTEALNNESLMNEIHTWSNVLVSEQMTQIFDEGASTTSYVYDSSGANLNKMTAIIDDAKSAGFNVRLIHVEVAVGTSLRRNEIRASLGGRRVPVEVIETKATQIRNTMISIIPLCDDVEIYNNDKDVVIGIHDSLNLVSSLSRTIEEFLQE